MSSGRQFFSFNLLLAISFGAVCFSLLGCTHEAKPDKPPTGTIDKCTLPAVSVGSDLRFTAKLLKPELLQSTKAEITIENGVKQLLEDAFNESVKVESKLQFDGNTASFDVPTTVDFKPGIWHVSVISFFDPKTKTWKELKEGIDFNGFAFNLINTTKFVTDKPSLEFKSVKAVDQ